MFNKSNQLLPPSTEGCNDRDEKDSCMPAYINCNGLRYAIPYEITTKRISIKDRFVGQSLDVVLGTMFRRGRGTQPINEAAAHWYQEIEAGRVEWRGPKLSRDDLYEFKLATIPPEVVERKGTSIRLRQHVHEKVVPASRINILFENDRFLAINKPAGLATIDEQGGNGVNSLMTMVGDELQKRRNSCNTKKLKLTAAHRLDKPVSGVLLIGKSPGQAAKLIRTIHAATKGLAKTDGVKKVYVARVFWNPESITLVKARDIKISAEVNGDVFPEDFVVEAELGWDSKMKRAIVMSDSGTKASIDRETARKVSLESTEKRKAWKAEKREAWKKRQKLSSKQNKRERESSQALPVEPASVRSDQLASHNTGPPEATFHFTSDTSAVLDSTENIEDRSLYPTIHTTSFRRLQPAQPDGTVLVECRPLTGQRHQIRAHLAAIGWPIANDVDYGGLVNEFSFFNECAYVDDEAGTLYQTLGSPLVQRPWCTKCDWTIQMLTQKDKIQSVESKGESDSHEGESGGLHKLNVEGGIWLHSMHYVIPSAGLDVCAPLPNWAVYAQVN